MLNASILIRDLDHLFNHDTGYMRQQGYIVEVSQDINIDPNTGVLTIPLIEAHISQIIIRGNKEVPTTLIAHDIALKPGDVLNQNQLDKDATQLYGTGLFMQVGPYTLTQPQQGLVNVIFPVTELTFYDPLTGWQGKTLHAKGLPGGTRMTTDSLRQAAEQFLTHAQPASALDELEQADRMDQVHHEKDKQATDLFLTASAYEALGSSAWAKAFFLQAKALDTLAGDSIGVAKNCLCISDVDIAEDRWDDENWLSLESAFPVFEKAKDLSREAKVYMNLAAGFSNTSNPAFAIQFYQHALPLLKKINAIDNQAKCFMGIGSADLDLSQPKKAICFLRQALPLFVQAKDTEGQAKDLYNLGHAAMVLGQPTQARDFSQQALPLFIKSANRIEQISDLLQISWIDLSKKQYAKSSNCLGQALHIFKTTLKETGSPLDDLVEVKKEASIIQNLGALETMFNLTDAISTFQSSLRLYALNGDKIGQANAMHNLMSSC